MKVGTDSILLGSWVASCLDQYSESTQYQTGLDIGAGSGLLALMLSQWADGELNITAVEIDHDTAHQATQNIVASPWPDSIKVTNSDIMMLSNLHSSTYDIIVANPPYFPTPTGETQSQQGLSAKRRVARSESTLTIADLFRVISVRLSTRGAAFVILPIEQYAAAKSECEKNSLFIQRQLNVKSLPEKPISRVCLALATTKTKSQIDNLNIYTAPNVYTEEYRALCRAYYLHF